MKSWAIIVGINEYHPDAGQPQLNGAVADAADFADWALHDHGGGVPPERLYFWTHPAPANPSPALAQYLRSPTRWWDLSNPAGTPNFDQPPVVANVTETALRAGKKAAAAARESGDGEERRCYVFFAGHGVQTNTTGATAEVQTCFVLGDFRPDTSTVMGLIPCEDFRRALLGGGFDQVFMFLDCCRVAMTRLNMPAPTIGSANTLFPPSPLWAVGNAAQKNKIAFETVAAPIRGAFSKTLLQGLRTLRDPQSEELTLENLKIYVRENIAANAPNEQRPLFIGEPSDPPPVVLKGPPIPLPEVVAPIRVNFGTVAPGTIVRLIDEKGVLAAPPLVAGPGVAEVPAVAGRFYSLDLAEPLSSKAFRHPGPGATDVTL